MLPVVRDEAETNRQILLYSVLVVASSVLLTPIGGAGYVYLGTAIALGGGFLALALRLWRNPRPSASRALFLYSLLYLGALFVAIALDRLVEL
jgi:protoheme IX farnesyltransferase